MFVLVFPSAFVPTLPTSVFLFSFFSSFAFFFLPLCSRFVSFQHLFPSPGPPFSSPWRGTPPNPPRPAFVPLRFPKRHTRPYKKINTKNYWNRKGDFAWSCSRWQTQPEKIYRSQRTNQCHSLRILYWFVLCNLLIFSGCVCHLKQLHAQSPFLFPIVFSINLIPFFEICSVLAVFSTRLFGYVQLYLGRCAVATVAVCGFGSWSLVFDCGMPRQISPLPPTPSQTEMRSMIRMRESIHTSKTVDRLFHNPTLSANKHVVQIRRSSLSTAVQTVQVSVEPHLPTALKDRSVAP